MGDSGPRREGVAGSGALAWIANIGAAAQAAIPGAYAWALTVAPAAMLRGAPWLARVTALAGPLALGAAIGVERRAPDLSRVVSVWGLVLTSVLVWMMVPSALSAVHMDATRGVAGMLGWALFALASAAPARKRLSPPAVQGAAGSLRPRAAIPRGDLAFIALGIVLALGLQTLGWQVASAERALFVRLVGVAAGLSIIGAATSLALRRYDRSVPLPPRARLRAATPWLVLTALLLIGGAFFALR